jgi:hypothetical protein
MRTYCWRRLDFAGLEILQLAQDAHGVEARATIIDAGDGRFSLQAIWSLDTDWRSRSLELTQDSADGVKVLRIERGQRSWVVNDKLRPDLADCMEVDLSATPFCNGLALHGLKNAPGELTALYVEASDLTVQASRQRYEQVGPRKWRYVDLGVADGFKAVLDFDEDGLVTKYEGLFERV